MTIHELRRDNFNFTLSDTDIVIVDCWASWCGACRDFAPVFEAAIERHPSIRFASLDTEAETELVDAIGITQIPTLLLFREGILVFKQPGYFDGPGLDGILAQAQSLDMELVKAEIAAQTASSENACESEAANTEFDRGAPAA